MAWSKSNTVKHNHLCTMTFGNLSKHSDCPRCEELKQGAAPRKGWAPQTVSRLDGYCFSAPLYADRCTKENNPSCGCGKRPYTD